MTRRSLEEYERKRDFNKTEEPSGIEKNNGNDEKKLIFVVQKHDATRLHYDFRLEHNGVLLSWAVPKGPSYNTKDRRLAVRVEDHPYDYRDFEGTIPRGEYGGGVVQVWDEGYWEPLGDVETMLEKGDLKFNLYGERLKGRWVLVRMKPKGSEEEKNWLLVKEKDGLEDQNWNIDDFRTSVKTGDTMEETGKEFYAEEELKKNKKKPVKKTSADKSEEKESEENGSKDNKVSEKEAGEESPESKKKAGEDKTVNSRKSHVSKYKLPFREAEVMLAELKKKPPEGKDWIYELKYDGYRILLYKENGKVRIITRNGQDYTEKMKELAEEAKAWDKDGFILDGEAVMFSGEKTDFQLLQNFMKSKKGKLTYMAFDILAYEGEDLRNRILPERKQILKDLLSDAPRIIRYSSHSEGNGEEIFSMVCSKGMEGIIAKDIRSTYTAGRHGGWEKIKCENRQEFVIAGFTRNEGREKGISSLLLALNEGGNLVYKGRAGTGFTEDSSEYLADILKPIITEKPMIEEAPRERKGEELFFVRPQYLAEIKYSEITDEGLLRQASFKGLRTDKPPSDVVLEKPTDDSDTADTKESDSRNDGKKDTGKKTGSRVKKEEKKGGGEMSYPEVEWGEMIPLTNPGKVMYGDVTKKDIDEYYIKVNEIMMPYFKERILSLVRCPDGEKGSCFYQKHLKEKMPGMENIEITESDGDKEIYFYGETPNAIHSAVQYGTIEFHGWGSRIKTLEYPDWMVFDLDPDEGMAIGKVKEGVLDLKSILDEIGLTSYLKTSGGKGYHICVPLLPEADWETVRLFAKNTAVAMEKKWPKKYTSNMSKEKRKGRIYIDWVRNGRTATSVLPYSLRNREGLPVSMPIRWEDLKNTDPRDITIKNIDKHLKADPWEGIEKTRQSLKNGDLKF